MSVLNTLPNTLPDRLKMIGSALLLSLLFGMPVKAQQRSWLDVKQLPQPEVGVLESYGPHPEQFAELMVPATGSGPFPVLIWFHGGCWLAEYDYRYTRPLARALADQGYAVWSVEYRRVGHEGGGWPGTFVDVASAADHLLQFAELHDLDLTKVTAAGHSAGGQLALWLAGRESGRADAVWSGDDDPPIQPIHIEPLPIHRVIALAPAADLDLMAREATCGNAAVRLLGGTPAGKAERYTAVAPNRRAPDLPQWLIDGAADKIWSAISESYLAAAGKQGVAVRRTLVERAGHFDLVVPEGAAWTALRHALAELPYGGD